MTKKLSELILEGSKLRPQGFGLFFRVYSRTFFRRKPKEIRSCALGAAVEAMTGRQFADKTMEIPINIFAIVPRETIDKIVGWNDRDKLTREAIAERLVSEGLDIDITY